MIGRKIVDQIDELLDAPEPPNNRYLQPPPLRIDTGRRLTAGMVFNECTNTTTNRNNPVTPRLFVHSVFTPNSSLTFGMPNPSTSFPVRMGSRCGSVSEASSRSNRYSVAEQALASALKNSEGERSPLELQICALQQVTAALSTRVEESREHVAKLKVSLTERDTDPAKYVTLQQERWMAEKRQSAVDKEVEMLTQHLKRLKANPDHHIDEDRGASPALVNEAKRNANLAHFFDYSPTRTSFTGTLDLKRRLALDQPFPRRMTMSDVSPLRLRPSSVTPPLRRLTTKHARPPSMAGDAFNPVKRPCRPRPCNSSSDLSPLAKVTENSAKVHSASDRSASHSSRLTTETFSDGSEGRVSTRPSTPPLSVSSMGTSSSSQGVGEETGGTATIISHVTSRTRSEILAALDKDTIHVPEYAVNLLGGFDLIHDEFSLPDRELFIKPREMKPIEVAPPPEPVDVPPPSEESDTGPYTSFALPPFTMETTWSHLSLNSPPSPSTPRMHRPSLQPLTPDSSSFSRSSTPTTPRPSQSSKGPRARHSLLFYMRKHKDAEYSPASSSVGVESLAGNSPVSGGAVVKKRFSFFSRK